MRLKLGPLRDVTRESGRRSLREIELGLSV